MPTTHLISKRAREDPSRLAPWDRDVPLLPRLGKDQKKLEARRHLQVENIVTTSASSLARLKKLTYRGSKGILPSTCKSHVGTGVGSKFESTRFKLWRPKATTLLFPSGNQVRAVLAHPGKTSCTLAHSGVYLFLPICVITIGCSRNQKCQQSFACTPLLCTCHFSFNKDKRHPVSPVCSVTL